VVSWGKVFHHEGAKSTKVAKEEPEPSLPTNQMCKSMAPPTNDDSRPAMHNYSVEF
jgi:hypothetical protein